MSEPYSNLPERVAAIEAILPHLATKADIAELRTEMAQMERRIEDRFHTMFRWMVGLLLTQIVGFLGLGIALYTALKP